MSPYTRRHLLEKYIPLISVSSAALFSGCSDILNSNEENMPDLTVSNSDTTSHEYEVTATSRNNGVIFEQSGSLEPDESDRYVDIFPEIGSEEVTFTVDISLQSGESKSKSGTFGEDYIFAELYISITSNTEFNYEWAVD